VSGIGLAAVGSGAAGPDVRNDACFVTLPWQSVALDLDGGANFAVELAIAMGILLEMAIDAVHAAFQMHVEKMNRHAIAIDVRQTRHRRRQRRRRKRPGSGGVRYFS